MFMIGRSVATRHAFTVTRCANRSSKSEARSTSSDPSITSTRLGIAVYFFDFRDFERIDVEARSVTTVVIPHVREEPPAARAHSYERAANALLHKLVVIAIVWSVLQICPW